MHENAPCVSPEKNAQRLHVAMVGGLQQTPGASEEPPRPAFSEAKLAYLKPAKQTRNRPETFNS